MNRMVVTTGGTGGHIFPALAVAREVRSRYPDCDILFMGGAGPEGKLAREHGLRFKALPARGILGRGIRGLVQSSWIAGGLALSMAEFLRKRPQAVAGFGGYAGFCPVLAARFMGIKCAVHEQNSVPGAANRTLARFVNRIFTSFEDKAGYFPEHKTVRTGNPVRREIALIGDEQSGFVNKNLLILGGSQGAKGINEAVVGALPELKKAGVKILHQAGPAHELEIKKAYEAAGMDPANVKGFIQDMAGAYAWSSLILCRSGASTVFEAAAAGKPCVFVPFPQATHNHQEKNAMAMVDAGAARLYRQSELTPETLVKNVLELIEDREQLKQMGRSALEFAMPQAASLIVDELEAMAGK